MGAGAPLKSGDSSLTGREVPHDQFLGPAPSPAVAGPPLLTNSDWSACEHLAPDSSVVDSLGDGSGPDPGPRNRFASGGQRPIYATEGLEKQAKG